jgi:hypothetical protein
VDSYSATKTEQSYTPGGAAVESKQTYKSGLNGTSSSSQSKVVNPDGSTEMTSHKESSGSSGLAIPPAGVDTTTTTTIQR